MLRRNKGRINVLWQYWLDELFVQSTIFGGWFFDDEIYTFSIDLLRRDGLLRVLLGLTYSKTRRDLVVQPNSSTS